MRSFVEGCGWSWGCGAADMKAEGCHDDGGGLVVIIDVLLPIYRIKWKIYKMEEPVNCELNTYHQSIEFYRYE